MRLSALFALALTGLCCVRPFTSPQAGGPAWIELRDDHFLLRTDLPADEARHLLRGLSKLRAVQGAVLAAPPPTERMQVWAPSQPGEQLAFADAKPRNLAASLFGAPSMWLAAGRSPTLQYGVLRALAEQRIQFFLPRPPFWLDEGLARYLMATRLEPDGVRAGAEVPQLGVARPAAHLKSVQIFSWTGDGPPSKHDASPLQAAARSWALVRYLAVERTNGFNAFLGKLALGEEPDPAFAAAFPQLTPAALDEEIRQAEASAILAPAPEEGGGTQQMRTLSEADLHALRAEAFGVAVNNFGDGAVKREAANSLLSDPNDALALELTPMKRQERTARFEAAARAHPDDFRAHYLFWASANGLADPEAGTPADQLSRALGEGRWGPFAQGDALDRAVSLAQGSFLPQLALAAVLLQKGDAAAAQAALGLALSLRPQEPAALDLLATAEADRNECPAALATVQRAARALPSSATEAWKTSFQARRAALLRRCSSAAQGR